LPRGAAARTQESVLYNFAGENDGSSPQGALIDVNGLLYGTTVTGGTSCAHRCGTVFTIATSGVESVIHDFVGGPDGSQPFAGLTNVNGVLYGTTVNGGENHKGTVFSITPSGVKSDLHVFKGGSDGAAPEAGLTDVDGVLYGTTSAGGAHGHGTVFAITTSGAESVLHSFASGNDGAEPLADLTDVNGVLYGTTESGGANGGGTVFKITTSGAETVIHNFGGGSDGRGPFAGLAHLNGALYGTTVGGGGTDSIGTVFKITTSGAESVIHSFKGATDGFSPGADLINVNGTLYGTTEQGGASGGYGTVFSITPAGAENVLYSFKGGTDGVGPQAALTYLSGVLYGTTVAGGANKSGTVFSLAL
jgi:uncharacterized repeat protein (TIGR03803 family)